jgi:exodeoxyribonuclease VII large subunit
MEVPQHFTLKQVADSIQKTISERYARTYWVTAEMVKLNPTRKGHCYPELVQKENDQIVVDMRATMWKTQYDRIRQRFFDVVKEPLQDGLELLFLVRITYHPIYNIGLEILDIDPNYTLGALQRERQETLERLNKEGILNANQLVEMALVPKRLAVISQVDSKGYSDFVTLLSSHPRSYHFHITLFEATLQGDAAILSIQKQLDQIRKKLNQFDAVVIVRGGGGEIGMHCYNNYDLSKAIATFPLPVLTGIGHSTNLTVCEMIAFRNGITPSDLAYFLLGIFEELDAPLDEILLKLPQQIQRLLQYKKTQFQNGIQSFQQNVQTATRREQNVFHTAVKDFEFGIKQYISGSKKEIDDLRKHIRSSSGYYFDSKNTQQSNAVQLIRIHTKTTIDKSDQRTQNLLQQLERVSPRILQEQLLQLNQKELQLKLIDPIHVLKRGYSIVTNEKGVLSAKNIAQAGQTLKIVTDSQEVNAEVKKK